LGALSADLDALQAQVGVRKRRIRSAGPAKWPRAILPDSCETRSRHSTARLKSDRLLARIRQPRSFLAQDEKFLENLK